jgi:hypothetical protein
MSSKPSLTIVVAAFLVGSPGHGFAAGANTVDSFVGRVEASARGQAMIAAAPRAEPTEQIARLVRPAPIGHRQPRAVDILQNTQPSSDELEQRRLDEEIDRKLIICRGC